MLSHFLTSSIFYIKMQVVFFNQIWSYLLFNLIFNSHLHSMYLLTPTLCFLFRIVSRYFWSLCICSFVCVSQYLYFITASCITDSIRHYYCPSFKYLLSIFVLENLTYLFYRSKVSSRQIAITMEKTFLCALCLCILIR